MKDIALVSVYSRDELQYVMYLKYLYQLLGERTPDESISHKEMPTVEQHKKFVGNVPYKAWYMIQSLEEADYPFVGAIYLSKDNEIGVGIFDKYKRQHYASAAIKALMDEHPEKYYYANVNTLNFKSKELFKRLGFKFFKALVEKGKVIQETYKFTSSDA